MTNQFIKKFLAFLVINVVMLPTPFVQASTILSGSTDQLFHNVANAQSVDFAVDIDVETRSETMKQSATIHIDFDGVSSVEGDGRFDLATSMTNDGEFHEWNGSAILSKNAVYFSENSNAWYVAQLGNMTKSSTSGDVEDTIDDIERSLQDLFKSGVIDYHVETVDFINKKPAIRYAYQVNNDRLVDALVKQNTLSNSEAAHARAFVAHQTISGSFWVDTVNMLPAMFTMNIHQYSSATSYTNVDISVLFKSFNEPVVLILPTNATDIKNYQMSAADTTTIENIGKTVSAMDTDSDGVTNADEETVWHTNPLDSDTDGDGYADHTEIVNGYNPNGSGKLDSDRDGLTDYAEMTIHWTNRFDADSDNDGYNDGLEIANGYNPNGPGRW